MAKTATKATAKPASRATQAAQHQNRPAPKPANRPAAQPAQRANVPARSNGPTADPPRNAMAQYGDISNVPDFMREDIGLGKEFIGVDDVDTPRLKLIQGLSPELQAYNDLRAGNFFHTASDTIFDEPINVVVVYMDKRYILWRPRETGGGILARADDGIHWSPAQGTFTVQLDKKDGGHSVTWKLAPTVEKSGLALWGTMNPRDTQSPPAATLMYNAVIAFPDYPELMPSVFTFQRSSIKSARRFNRILSKSRHPIFGCVFKMGAFQDTNRAGQDFFNVQMEEAGLLKDQGLYNQYKTQHLQMKQAGLRIKDEGDLQQEEEHAGDVVDENAPSY